MGRRKVTKTYTPEQLKALEYINKQQTNQNQFFSSQGKYFNSSADQKFSSFSDQTPDGNIYSDNSDIQNDENDSKNKYDWAKSWMNQILEQDVDGAKWDIAQQQFEKICADRIKQWDNLYKEKQQVLNYYQNGAISKQEFLNRSQKIDQQLSSLNDFFLGEGRRSDIVVKHMFNKHRDEPGTFNYAFDTAVGENARSVAKSIKNDANEKYGGVYKNGGALLPTLPTITGDILGDLIDNVSKPLKSIWDTAGYLTKAVGSGFSTPFIFGKNLYDSLTGNKDKVINSAIRKAAPNDPLLKYTYRGNNEFDQQQILPVDKATLQKDLKDVDKKIEDSTMELNLATERAKLGQVTAFGHTIFTYDPNTSNQWEEDEKEYGKNWYDPITMPGHWFASTASTVGLMKYQLYSMGYEAAVLGLGKALGDLTTLGPAGKVAKVGVGALKMVAPAVAVGSTVASRDAETSLEAVSGYTERVMQDAIDNGADFEKVISAIDQEFGSKESTRKFLNLPLEDRLRYGMVYGVKTGDEAWDNALVNSHKGIQELINKNNALASADFIEILPYLPYTGSLAKRTIQREIFGKSTSKLRNATSEAVDRLFRSKKVQQVMDGPMWGLANNKINKVSKYFVKHDMPKLALMTQDVANYIIPRATFGLSTMAKEGIEEGQQELLQSRYKRGEYDNIYYHGSFPTFEDILGDVELAKDAVFAYAGILNGDLDNGSENIRKAMNIGASSSLLFSNATHMLTNLSPFGSNAGNLSELVENLKTSNTVANIIANDYQKNQDYQHAKIFYEAIKQGKKPGELKRKLQLLKDYQDKEKDITQDMVDADKLLIDNVDYMYHNKALADIYKKKGFEKYGDEHMFSILDGAVRLTDLQKTYQLLGEQEHDANKWQKSTISLMEQLVDPITSKEEKQKILNEFPFLEDLYKIIDDEYVKNEELKQGAGRLLLAKTLVKYRQAQSDEQRKEVKKEAVKLGLPEIDFDWGSMLINEGQEAQSVADSILSQYFNLDHKKRFFTDRLRQYYIWSQLRGVNAAIKLSKDQKQLLEYVRQMTGLDVDTTQLKGMLDELYKVQKKYLAKVKKPYESTAKSQIENELGEIKNNYNKEELSNFINQRVSKLINEDSFNSKDMNWDFDDEQSKKYKNLLIGIALNMSLIKPQQTLASAYEYGKSRAKDVRNAIYSNNTEESTEFDDLVNKQEEVLSRLLDDTQESETMRRNADRIDADKLSEDAAWQLMEKRRNHAEKRAKIARRSQIKSALEEQGKEITQEDVQVIDETVNPELQSKPTQKQQSSASSMSVAEKDLRKRYTHQDVDKEEKKQQAIDKRREELRKEQEQQEQQKNEETSQSEPASEITETPIEESPVEEPVELPVEDDDLAKQIISPIIPEVDQNVPQEPIVPVSNLDQEIDEQSEEQLEEKYDDESDVLRRLTLVKNEQELMEVLSNIDYEASANFNYKITKVTKFEKEYLDPHSTIYSIRIPDGDTPLEGNKHGQGFIIAVYAIQDGLDNFKTDNELLEGDEIKNIQIKTNSKNIKQIVVTFKRDGKTQVSIFDRTSTSEEISKEQEAQMKQEQDNEAMALLDMQTMVEQNEITTSLEEQINETEEEYTTYQNLYIDEAGNICNDNGVLEESKAREIEEELNLLAALENYTIDQNSIPLDVEQDDDIRMKYVTDEFIGNYVANTFFYAVDERKTESLADKGTTNKFNGAELPKDIGTAEELSKHLSEKGWFDKTKKYYVVTKPKEADYVTHKENIRNAYTVALVLEDSEKCYLTFLRDIAEYKTESGSIVSNELDLMNWLQTKNANIDKIVRDRGYALPHNKKDRYKAISQFLADRIKESVRNLYMGVNNSSDIGFEDYYHKGIVTKNNEKLLQQREAFIKIARNQVLRAYGLNRSYILDDEIIKNQIKQLKDLRNEIIAAYGEPTTSGKVKTTVEPDRVQQSNGRINNQKTVSKLPILKPLVSANSTLDEITEKIETGKLFFGFGRGALSSAKFEISPLLEQDQNKSRSSFKGRGLSGKIYLFVNSLISDADGGRQVPIMLTEQKFNTQTRVKDGKIENRFINKVNGPRQVLKLDATGKLVADSEFDADGYQYQPSIAEVLFYMITHKVDFGINDFDKIDSIVEFFIHHGDKTLFTNNRYGEQLNKTNPLFNVFSSKQIAYQRKENSNDYVLKIALPDEEGGYEVKDFSESDLFTQSETKEDQEQAKANRQLCINMIANQLHWNTDKVSMNSNIDPGSSNRTEISQFIKYLFDTQAKSLQDCDGDVQEYLNQSVSILGCPDLTFNLGDFYEDNSENDITNPIKQKSVNTLAWMLKNGKLLTDVGNPIFKDPFVFGFGVKQNQEGEVSKETDTDESKNKPLTSSKDPFHIKSKLDIFTEGLDEVGLDHIAQTEEERQDILDDDTKIKPLSNGGQIVDNILLDVIPKQDEDLLDSIERRINELLEEYKKTNSGIEFSNTKDLSEEISSNKSVSRNIESLENGDAWIAVKMIKQPDGKYKYTISVQDYNGLAKSRNYYTGVFSEVDKHKKHKGKYDKEEGFEWLASRLGIERKNHIVLRGLVRASQDRRAYGATTVAVDAITGQLVAKFFLSRQEGSNGVNFHEAWHYVNLLLHNKAQRFVIYDEYVKSHKELRKPGVTYKDVEEAMAEDFLLYMQRKLDTSLLGKIRRFFDNIMQFINIWLDRKKYQQIYKLINDGHYKNKQILEESAKEFIDNYGGEVLEVEHPVSGLSEQIRQKLVHFESYQEVFDTIDSIINYSLIKARINSIEDAYEYVKGDAFKKIIDNIDNIESNLWNEDEEDYDDLDYDTQHKIDLLEDIKDNPKIIEDAVAQRFESLGFNTKIKQIERKNQSVKEDGADKEKTDDYDNTWDKLELSESRKDNASVRVKTFFSTIVKSKPVATKTGAIKMEVEYDEFGVEKLWDFNQVWNDLAKDLSECTSYEKLIDGRYDPYSIRGTVKRLAKVNPLYKEIDFKLNSLEKTSRHAEDSQLKSQIFATFNSHYNHIQTMNIQNPYVAETIDLDDMSNDDDISQIRSQFTSAVADVDRTWKLSDDGMYNPVWTLPRRWSQMLVSQGFAIQDKVTKQLVISKEFATNAKNRLDHIKEQLKRAKKEAKDSVKNGTTSESVYYNVLQNTKQNDKNGVIQQIINLYNMIGIPMDRSVFNIYMLRMLNAQDEKSIKNSDIFNIISDNNGIIGSTARGSLSYFINQMVDDIGKSEINTKNAKGFKQINALDEMYNGYGINSDIGRIALAYSSIYPSIKEMSTRSANGDTLYPINLNNQFSDIINSINLKKNQWAEDQKSPYCNHSIIRSIASEIRDFDEQTKLRLNCFVGIKSNDYQEGNDYLKITPIEDYLSKMLLTENDNLLCPTMADKKTWYSLSIGSSALETKEKIGDTHGFKLSHDVIVRNVTKVSINSAIVDYYSKHIRAYDKSVDKGINSYNIDARKWYYALKEENPEQFNEVSREVEELAQIRDQEHGIVYNRFSIPTIERFCGYFMDELNTIIQYYNRESIHAVTSQPGKLRENYHGELDENGRLKFGGQGGLFRYFYDVKIPQQNQFCSATTNNLNQILQSLWLLEQKLINGESVDNLSAEEESLYTKIGLNILNDKRYLGGHSKAYKLDGFELIREYLDLLKQNVEKGNDNYTDLLMDSINEKLMRMTEIELKKLANPDSPLNLVYEKFGKYLPKNIPVQFILPYLKKMDALGIGSGSTAVYKSDKFGDVSNNDANSDAVWSLIGNFVVNQMTSTIEIEKIVTGDPAFYKWKNSKNSDTVTITYAKAINGQEVKCEETFDGIDVVKDMADDKVKRLGGPLSPGTNLRLDYTPTEIQSDIDIVSKYVSKEKVRGQAILGGSKYTVLDVDDIECASESLAFIKDEYARQTVIDLVRCGKIEYDGDIHTLYTDNKKYQEYYNKVKDILLDEQSGVTVEKYVEEEVAAMAHPMEKITVSDAQVFIRPALYRKIRKSLGEWTQEDEEAYWILETDDTWMDDEVKSKKIRKFQQNVLKMSYFENSPELITNGCTINIPLYNKMAIFPLFKFQRSTDTGRALYDRMNRVDNEIDMIAFKSAVKVGAVSKQTSLQLIDTKKAGVKHATSVLSKRLNKDSNVSLNYQTDEINNKTNNKKDLLTVKIQDLHNLRKQLNTNAHEDDERNIGTQMFKQAFSNTIDDELYGNDKEGREPRLGKDIKDDIMRLINKLTELGVQEVQHKFYEDDGTGNLVLSTQKVIEWIKLVIQNNGLGAAAEEIIDAGGVISSLMSRKVFEQSASKLINEDIVNINTHGGAAIQQSMFGFAAYGNYNVTDQNDQYIEYNQGKELKWNANEGSMEVILSIKFFRSVVPSQYRHSFKEMRQWLIDNDIILGKKTSGYGPLSDEEQKINDILDKSIDELQLDAEILEILKKDNCKTVEDVIRKASSSLHKASLKNIKIRPKQSLKQIAAKLEELGVNFETRHINPKSIIGEEMSKPKPFGIGYRIPTQGMSSMFCFTVADVLPEQVGDLIIVPREFTAQTGSDFDVDKLYLATLAYKKGELEREKSGEESSKNAYANELLLDYMDIISDRKNFAQSRGSIDVFTDMLKDQLLPELRDEIDSYVEGGYCLLPSFQAFRKMEFSTGKTGIGPFALNITNLALTQYTHLTIDFGKQNNDGTYGEFHLKSLDSIYGKDNRLISGWLSAMVNAHVDVAKDPYIFALNVNQTTYNITNFLLRTGNGMATFAFLTQPILKLYAQQANNKGGIYGKNMHGDENSSNSITSIQKNLYRSYVTELEKYISTFNENTENEEMKTYVNNVYLYFKHKVKSKENVEEDTEKTPKLKVKWDSLLNLENNLQHLKLAKKLQAESITIDNASEKEKVEYAKSKTTHLVYQLLALKAYSKLDNYAEAMSTMVKCSQIDTKKFGNDITKQRLWYNKYMNNRYTHNVRWIINDDTFKYRAPKNEKGEIDSAAASDMAVNEYFEKLYLNDKLVKALKYTKELLSTQCISATKEFEDLYTNIMQGIYGKVEFDDLSAPKGQQNRGEGYGTQYRQNSAESISDCIDNIVRFNSFMNLGSEIYNDEINENPGTNMIDFTFGGNIESVIDKVQQLYFGGEGVPDIFKRIINLITELKQNTNKVVDKKYVYAKLVDNDGTIKNDLLNYLQPMLPTTNYPVGRMMLAETQMNIDSERKRKYISAFNELLANDTEIDFGEYKEKISDIAKDLAIFAYYSTYDQNGPGSFFDLVPVAYRAQYDRALSKVFDLNSKDRFDVFTGGVDDSGKKILDVIARNYWYDDDIVPSYSYQDDAVRQKNIFTSDYGEMPIRIQWYDSNAKYTFPAGIISNSKFLPKTDFFKLSHNGVSYLYKKVGTIQRIHKTPDGRDMPSLYVYAVVPKAGMKQKGIQQFELYANYVTDSIFGQNMLPESFSEDNIRKNIEELVQSQDKESKSHTFSVTWNTGETVPESRKHTNLNAYSQTSSVSLNQNTNVGNIVLHSLNPGNNPEYVAQKNADVVINVTLDDSEFATKQIKKVKDSRGEWTIPANIYNLRLGSNVEDLITWIKNFIVEIDNDQEKEDKPIKIQFSTFSKDYIFRSNRQNATDQFNQNVDNTVREIIEQKINDYTQKINSDDKLSENEKSAAIAIFTTNINSENELKKIVRQAVEQETYAWVSEIIKQLRDNGINVGEFITSVDSDKTLLTRSIASAGSLGLINGKITAYISSSWETSIQTKKYLEIFKNDLKKIYKQGRALSDTQSKEMTEEEFINEVATETDSVTVPVGDISDTSGANVDITDEDFMYEEDVDDNFAGSLFSGESHEEDHSTDAINECNNQ